MVTIKGTDHAYAVAVHREADLCCSELDMFVNCYMNRRRMKNDQLRFTLEARDRFARIHDRLNEQIDCRDMPLLQKALNDRDRELKKFWGAMMKDDVTEMVKLLEASKDAIMAYPMAVSTAAPCDLAFVATRVPESNMFAWDMCRECTAPSVPRFSCPRCKSVKYCCDECRAADWKGRHKKQCKQCKTCGKKVLCLTDSQQDEYGVHRAACKLTATKLE
jgi:hypothetical protein